MAEAVRYEQVLGPIAVGLRKDLHVTRQRTRSGPRYVVHDPVTFHNHAFTPDDYRILSAIVPKRRLSAAFDHLVAGGALEARDKSRFYELVLWLHGAGLLQLPVSRGDLLYERRERKRAARRASPLSALLSCKVRLVDPDQFLQRTLRWVGWLFSRTGFLLWVLLMAVVAWKCTGRFGELLGQTTGLLRLHNLPILWVALVALKALHELGHAYACRVFGGAVPEMGVVFIVMTPCAYVDANASWKFDRVWHRVAVAMAGMYVESIVAGMAALVWAGTQPGFAHDVALDVVVLASVVTVFLNLNPLMRFDGYYVFSDLAGVLNLQDRAFRLLKAWAGHLALGQPRPAAAHGRAETWLYALYGPCAFAYRVGLGLAITSLVVLSWPAAGALLGAVFFWMLIARPVVRLYRWLWTVDDTRAVRTRARLVAVGALASLPLLVAFLPVSASVVAPGVLDPQARRSVRAPASGFVAEVPARNGEQVSGSNVVCVLRNPELELRRLRLLGEAEAEATRLDAIELEDSTQAATHRARLGYLRSGVLELERRLASMRVVAGLDGTVASPDWRAWEGRFVREGELLFQIHAGHHYVRVVLTDHEVSRARLEVGSVAEVRWACQPDEPVRAVVREIRRSSSRAHVPLALTMLAGGEVYARPAGDDGAVADEPYLHVLLEAEAMPLGSRGAGLTARVRVEARVEVLGAWLKRRVLGFVNAWRMS